MSFHGYRKKQFNVKRLINILFVITIIIYIQLFLVSSIQKASKPKKHMLQSAAVPELDKQGWFASSIVREALLG